MLCERKKSTLLFIYLNTINASRLRPPGLAVEIRPRVDDPRCAMALRILCILCRHPKPEPDFNAASIFLDFPSDFLRVAIYWRQLTMAAMAVRVSSGSRTSTVLTPISLAG